MQVKVNNTTKNVPNLLESLRMVEVLEALKESLEFLCENDDTKLGYVLVQYFTETKQLFRKLKLRSDSTDRRLDNICISMIFTVSSILALNGQIAQAFRIIRRNCQNPQMKELQGHLWSTAGKILSLNSASIGLGEDEHQEKCHNKTLFRIYNESLK